MGVNEVIKLYAMNEIFRLIDYQVGYITFDMVAYMMGAKSWEVCHNLEEAGEVLEIVDGVYQFTDDFINNVKGVAVKRDSLRDCNLTKDGAKDIVIAYFKTI